MREPHLVGEPTGSAGGYERALALPLAEPLGGPRILVSLFVIPGLFTPQDESHHVVRRQRVEPSLLVGCDVVVRWRRDPVERTHAKRIEQKTGER